MPKSKKKMNDTGANPLAPQGKKKKGKRKKKFHNKKKGIEGDAPWVDPNPPLNRKDAKVVRGYLQAYKEGALREASGGGAVDSAFSEPTVIVSDLPFPALNVEAFRKPYLQLPAINSVKRRNGIHDICIDLDLFHDSVGDRGDRRIIVSIYSDGLDHCDELSPWTGYIPIRECRPWVRTGGQQVVRKTNQAKKSIQELIDQPSKCLRDGIDALDFEEMKSDDLSGIGPPEDDNWLLVDSAEKMLQCIREIEESKPTEIAFDLEAYNKSNFLQQTCLLQITCNSGKEYVIDTLASGVWECVPGLAPLFADPNIVKIGHSISGLDARCLHRDFGIFIVNVFDTYEAATQTGSNPRGLAQLCGHYGMSRSAEYQVLKDQYQNTNWRQRPLTKDMIQYGRHDIHFLIPLRRLLMRDLAQPDLYDQPDGYSKDQEARQVASSLADILRRCDEDDEFGGFGGASIQAASTTDSGDTGYHTSADKTDDFDGDEFKECIGEPQSKFDAAELRMNSALMHVLSISQDRCLDLWNLTKTERHLNNSTFLKYVERSEHGEIVWHKTQLQLYDQLARWREHCASLEMCLQGFCCSLDFLAQVCHRRPVDHSSLRRITYNLPIFLGHKSKDGDGTTTYEDELLTLVRASRDAHDRDQESEGAAISTPPPSYSKDYLARVARRRKWIWLAASVVVTAAVAAVVSISSARRRRK